MPHRVVVVEDNLTLNELMCGTLRTEGYEVSGFLDAESLIESTHLKDTEVVVLDIQLPGESGLVLAKRLRSLIANLGILFLTTRTSNQDRIEGYKAGGDYYLPKPLKPEELVEAVRSLLDRRRQMVAGQNVPESRYRLSKATFVFTVGRQSIKFSAAEANILVALAGAPDRQLEYWQIIDLISSDDSLVSRASLDVRVFRLKSKLREITDMQHPIVSVRGVGYRLGFAVEII